MIPRIRTAVVVGAGTMGAQISCLLAGAGCRVRLLDLDAERAANGLAAAIGLRPPPLYVPEDAGRIVTGGLEELEEAVAGADWVLEAIVERREPKRALLARVDDAIAGRERPPIVSTNTSGIPIASLVEGRSEALRRNFLGTHFFNPPRLARLLELVPSPATSASALARIEGFASRHLGKGTIHARDVPAFVGNRLGVHGLLAAIRLAQELDLGYDRVDELTGPLIGRPRSAVFRTLDVVGLDVALAVADDLHEALAGRPDRDDFAAPEVLRRLVADGRLGAKSGAGFYRREGREILVLDPARDDYVARAPLQSPAVEAARGEADLGRRLERLLAGDDAPARFLWRLISDDLRYAAEVGGQTTEEALSVDRAMSWGFGWALGPFATWDALGVRAVAERLRSEGRPVPELVVRVGSGPGRFHRDGETVRLATAEPHPVPPRPGAIDLAAGRSVGGRALPANDVASMTLLPGDVLGLELHGKLNVIGPPALDMLERATERAEADHDGLVIGTDAADFSAGADLRVLLADAEEGAWDRLEALIARFQALARRIRLLSVPVVAAPRGRVLGGGAELCLAAARRQALVETAMGLVETGVGLVPAGGGCAAMARACAARAGDLADRLPAVLETLETVGGARVSTSGADARRMGLLGPADGLTADPDRQWGDAARVARTLAEVGYRPPDDAPVAVIGRRGIAAARALTHDRLLAGRMSAHDRTVVLALAEVLCGGDVAEGTRVSEAHLLDLEREAFLRLLGEPLTRERIASTLRTGRRLRN